MIEKPALIDISEQIPESGEEETDGEVRGATCFDTLDIPGAFLALRKRPNKHLYSEISTPLVSSFVINISDVDSLTQFARISK